MNKAGTTEAIKKAQIGAARWHMQLIAKKNNNLIWNQIYIKPHKSEKRINKAQEQKKLGD